MTWQRLIVSGLLACAAIIAYALHDLAKTLARAVELPQEDQRG